MRFKLAIPHFFKENRITARPIRWFWILMGIEAILSLIGLSRFPFLVALAESVQGALPVVGNILHYPNASPDTAPYLAFTTLFIVPVKVYAIYFIIDQDSAKSKAAIGYYPLSDASLIRKVRTTIFVLLLCSLFIWYSLIQYGSIFFVTTSSLGKEVVKFNSICRGGIGMWFSWSLTLVLPLITAIGMLFVFTIEWIKFIRDKQLGDRT